MKRIPSAQLEQATHRACQHDVDQRETMSRRSKRRGVYTMELVLTLPILAIVLAALLEFSLLFFARGTLVEATRVGARRASMAGTTVEDVENEIRKVLSPSMQRGLRIGVDRGEHSGDVVTVTVESPMRNASPDLLWPIGISSRNKKLYSTTRMIRE